MKIAEYLKQSVLTTIEGDIKALQSSIGYHRESMEKWTEALKKDEALLEEAMELRTKILSLIQLSDSW